LVIASLRDRRQKEKVRYVLLRTLTLRELKRYDSLVIPVVKDKRIPSKGSTSSSISC